MTVFRLATATVLLAGLALPVLAQGTATPIPTVPGIGAVTRGTAAPVAPTATLPTAATPAQATPAQATTAGTAKTRATTTQAVVTPGAGDAGVARAAPVATPSAPRADAGAVEARPGRTDAGRVERMERRSHHRLASETRMERTRLSHGQPVAGDAASDATR